MIVVAASSWSLRARRRVRIRAALWVHALLWMPLILATTLLPLRPMKGLLIALQYRHKAAEGRAASERGAHAGGLLVPSRVRARRAGRPARARHLAGRAQGLEGKPDRDAGTAAQRPPVALPPPNEWQVCRRQFGVPPRPRAVRVHQRRHALVYTSGSALRDDIKAPAISCSPGAARRRPARSSSIAASCPTATIRAASGEQEIIGVLRWPEGLRVRADPDEAGSIWFVRDPPRHGAGGLGRGRPVLHRAGAPVPPGGVPQPAPLKVQLRNDHLQYASPGSAWPSCWWSCSRSGRPAAGADSPV